MSSLSLSAADFSLRPARTPFLETLDRLLAPIMFYLAAVFLILAAGVIHRLGHIDLGALEADLILWGLVVLWPLFVLEGLLRLAVCRRPETSRWRRLAVFLGVCLFPPFRLGGRAYADVGTTWLPGLGLSKVDRILRIRLERFFSVPMIIIAFLVLPFLAMEYFWLETVRAHFGLSLLLDIGTSVIWLAFALEVIIMVSATEQRLRYCLANWMDLAVVFLPLLDFLPILRLVRMTELLELQQVSRLGRLYRLRGLISKIWRLLLLLELIQHLLGHYREKRLVRLKDLLAARLEEVGELRAEIAELEKAPASM
jgi:hypothetical protein